MTVLVTGGAGYIGSHTVVELQNAGYEAVSLDNYANSSESAYEGIAKITGKPVKHYEADIRDRAALERIFSENDISCVIHFAGLKAVGESVEKPDLYYDNNVNGSRVLFDAMKAAGVSAIIFSSSATVYGDGNPPYSEEDPRGIATNPYADTKIKIEEMIEAEGFERAIILRYFNPAGAHESALLGESPNGIPNNLMPYISKVARGKLEQLSVYGNDYPTPDGSGVRDYIHVVDLAKGHVAALRFLEKEHGVHIFNLGTGHGVSVLEMIKAYENANGIKIPFRIAARRPGDVAVSYAVTDKANTVLGWHAEKSVEDMCRDAYRFESKNS